MSEMTEIKKATEKWETEVGQPKNSATKNGPVGKKTTQSTVSVRNIPAAQLSVVVFFQLPFLPLPFLP